MPLLRPLLTGICDDLEGGFGSSDVDRIAAALEGMQPDEPAVAFSFLVTFEGADLPLEIEAYLDDVDSCAVYCFSSAPLAGASIRR